MKKLFIPFIIPIILFIFFRLFFLNPDTLIHNFFSSYGFTLSPKPIETETVILPTKLTPVYENYNVIQKKAGLDIIPYLSKKVKRYTYEVLNFPFETSEKVLANVLIYKNKIIAADIMTTSLDGFMLSPADEVFKNAKFLDK